MAKKVKTKLKERNPYAFYRNGYYAFKGAKWTSIIAPFVTIFAINFQEYFMVDDGSGSQVKMSLGCILALFVGGVAFWQESKKKSDGSSSSSPVSNVLGWAVAFALCYFFQSILNDLTTILGCALVGQLAGLGFEMGATNRAFYMNEYKKANIQSSVLSNATKSALNSVLGKKNDTNVPPID